MHKLDYLSGTEWIAHSFAPRFASTKMPDGSGRIVAGVPQGDTEIFERLVSSLEPPYLLLYILHTPRGEGVSGRYQSPPLSVGQLHSFISKFKPFLSGDARFDIWAHSPSEHATVVWDRHNMLYAYGPTENFSKVLRSLGFDGGEPEIPAPHTHHYRKELDGYARELLTIFDWSWSPLRDEDRQ
jgi:hypothetical protein